MDSFHSLNEEKFYLDLLDDDEQEFDLTRRYRKLPSLLDYFHTIASKPCTDWIM